MNLITMVFPYYEAPKMLGLQMLNIASYPSAVKEMLTIIVVDDGSPQYNAYDIVGRWGQDFKVRLYRVKPDIPWNNHGARNLGFLEAEEDAWVLGLDVKHLVPAACMDWLIWGDMEPQVGKYYTFPYVDFRQAKDGSVNLSFVKDRKCSPTKPHPNTFLVSRKDFWRAGGYNEDFSGTYGGDGEFMKRLSEVAEEVNLAPNFWVTRVDRTVVSDSMAMVESRDYFHGLYLAMRSHNRRPVDPIRFEWFRLL